tara:strand:- start:836 stop:1915 length:1080 start_codon:yes stop_codon:yes gene_type:complete
MKKYNIIMIVMMSFLFSSASVQIIHNSASPTVDIYIDDALAVAGFEYRTATAVLDLPLEFIVGIAPAGDDIIAEFPFSLEDGGEYVVVATGLLGNDITPFGLAAAGTTFGADEGLVGLNVYHGSTDAPGVDILADGNVLVPDLMYGEFSGYVAVAEMDYTIGIAPTGGNVIAEFVAPLTGLGGNSAIVFASGFLSGDDPAFGLFAALEDGTVLTLPTYMNECDTCMEFCVDYVVENYGYTEEEATNWCLNTPDDNFGCADSCGALSNDLSDNPIFELNQSYPNPFNPNTTITFQIKQFSDISINVYDINGRIIANLFDGFKKAGEYSINWNASDIPSGTYFVNMNTNSFSSTQKLTLIK